ncbi:MAG: caspase family protein [Candidatus Cloacimonetes bacterium]|nr:caspase family protein [Candidatus Cloacimonadota bacterium]
MKKHLILWFIMMVSLSAFAQRKALVIGNSGYDKYQLKTSLNDAQLAADAFTAMDYEVSLYKDQSYSQMLAAINSFKKNLSTNDVAVFYYAGYTVQECGKNYLLPYTQAKDKKADLRQISVDTILEALTRAHRSFMILESRQTGKSFPKNLCSKDKGLAKIDHLGKNQGFVMASAPGKELQQQGEKYSIFTYTLFSKMTSSMMNYPELMQESADAVKSYTKKAQIPYWQSTLDAPFSFWEQTQQEKLRLNFPTYRFLDGGGSYNF